MINNIPFLYDPDWHQHEVCYNQFYDIHLIQDDTIINDDVIFPFMIFENKNKGRTMYQGGFFSVTPFFLKREDWESSSYKKLFRNLIRKAAASAIKNDVQDFYIHQFPLQTFNRPFSYCQEMGYKTFFRGRNFIDFKENSADDIWSHIRKSYRNLIRKIESPIIHYGSISHDVFSSLVDRHLELAGRKTKPDMCWDILKAFVDTGRAVVVQQNNDFLYFFVSSQYAYYAISAAERNRTGITHALLWKAIEFIKEIGCDTLDLGIYYPTDVGYPITNSEKNDFGKIKNISHFKNGFANKVLPDYYSQLI